MVKFVVFYCALVLDSTLDNCGVMKFGILACSGSRLHSLLWMAVENSNQHLQ